MKRGKIAVIVLSWLVLLTFLSSCKPNYNGEQPIVFHYNQHNNITSLDPAFAKSQNNMWAVNHIFSTLVRLDDNLNVIPGIAKSWQVSEDAQTYTFILRQDVLFHEDPCFLTGDRSLVAQDVVYSYNRLMDTTLNAPGSWIFKDKVRVQEPFKALNDTTFVLTLAQPFAPLVSLLTMQYCSIVPEEAITYYGADFFTHPVGSGPFAFKRWLNSQGLFLKRNDEYYARDEHPDMNIEGIRTSFIGERSIAFLELMNKRIDFFSGLESSYINTALTPDGRLREEHQGEINFIKSPYLNFEYMGINYNAKDAHPLLKEKSFRQALNYGVDRQMMLTSLRNGIGVSANSGVITRGLPSFDSTIVKGYRYDRNKALNLIRQFSLEQLSTPLTIHTSKDYLDLTTYIAKQWEDLGLTTKIEVMESATLRNAMRAGDIGLFRASWIADYPDGESFLSMFYSSNPAPPNYTRYSNPAFDELYQEALRSINEASKLSLYQDLDRMLIEDAPVIFLFYDEVSIFANSDIKGLSKNALNLLQVDGIIKEVSE